MDRHAFLSRLRARRPADAETSLPRPMRTFDEIPRLAYLVDLSDPVATFTEKASGAMATVREVDEPRAILEEVVEAHDVRTAVASRDPETEGVPDMLGELGVDVGAFSLDDVPAAHLGVTGAAWGIAATGTLVCDAGRAGGRSASLVPEVHLALVRRDRILPEAGDLFREMRDRYPDGPPSQLVLVTGPSRSADIELTLTMGVHGPKAVWIGILPG